MSLAWIDLSPPQSRIYILPQGVVDPIARTDIDLQLRKARLQVPVLAGVPFRKALDPGLNSGTALQILEAIQPPSELRGCFELSHDNNRIPQDTYCKTVQSGRAVLSTFERDRLPGAGRHRVKRTVRLSSLRMHLLSLLLFKGFYVSFAQQSYFGNSRTRADRGDVLQSLQ